ncbi:MAG: tRNA pseudouridine(55) synthase TruB [bacterium]
MNGILLINKEQGPTSFGAIEQVKRKFGLTKIGHSGTLDPLAKGLLITLVGKATKIAEYLPSDKEYELEITFGRATNTDDAEGETVKEFPVPSDLEKLVLEMLPSFIGEVTQIPPKFAAIKKDGKKLYELARAGKEVNPEPRTVNIYSIKHTQTIANKIYLTIACGSGTYMRSIARDLGEKIGSCAYLSALTRTKIGNFTLSQSHKIEEMETLEANLISMNDALVDMPFIILSDENFGRIKNGMPVDNTLPFKSGIVKLLYENEVAAIGQIKYGKVYVKRGI